MHTITCFTCFAGLGAATMMWLGMADVDDKKSGSMPKGRPNKKSTSSDGEQSLFKEQVRGGLGERLSSSQR